MARPARLLVSGLLVLNIAVILAMSLLVPFEGPNVTLAPALRLERRPTTGVMRARYTILPPFSNPAVEARVESGQRPAIQTSDYFLHPFGVHQKGAAGIGLYLASLAITLILCTIMLYLFPERLLRMREAVGFGWGQALRSALTGILGYILLGGLVILLGVQVVGIPLAALIILALILLSLAALTAASLAIGRGLSCAFGVNSSSPLLQIVLGILLLFPLIIIPIAGWALAALASSLGFGAILLTKFGNEEGWTLQP